jgi:hypothetical protein
MSEIVQNSIVLVLVAMCAAFVLWQIVRALRGRGGKVGSCCSKGCASDQATDKSKPVEHTVFMPVENLIRRR